MLKSINKEMFYYNPLYNYVNKKGNTKSKVKRSGIVVASLKLLNHKTKTTSTNEEKVEDAAIAVTQ